MSLDAGPNTLDALESALDAGPETLDAINEDKVML